MQLLNVTVRNGFALREALRVALEVTWPDLPEHQADSLRSLVDAIPGCIGSVDLRLEAEDRSALEACLTHFRQSHTWYWLREDFATAIGDFEYRLARC